MSHGRRELDLPTYILLHSSSLENDAMWDVPVCSDFLWYANLLNVATFLCTFFTTFVLTMTAMLALADVSCMFRGKGMVQGLSPAAPLINIDVVWLFAISQNGLGPSQQNSLNSGVYSALHTMWPYMFEFKNTNRLWSTVLINLMALKKSIVNASLSLYQVGHFSACLWWSHWTPVAGSHMRGSDRSLAGEGRRCHFTACVTWWDS